MHGCLMLFKILPGWRATGYIKHSGQQGIVRPEKMSRDEVAKGCAIGRRPFDRLVGNLRVEMNL